MTDREYKIWETKPTYKARWAFLEIFGGGSEIGPYTAVLPVLFILNIIGIIKMYHEGNYLYCSMFVFVLCLLMFFPEFHKHIRRKKTAYVVTNQSITFYDYWYGKKKKNTILLKDIIRVYLVNYKDDIGVIYIYSKEKNFYTRNFWSGSIRPTITMEDIENATESFNTLNDILRKYSKN